MMAADLQAAVEGALLQLTGEECQVLATVPVGGGCIHRAVRVETTQGAFFLKHNSQQEIANFDAEVEGLHALRDAGAVKAPGMATLVFTDTQSGILMEWVAQGPPGPHTAELLGRQLATLHGHTATAFGWHRGNYIGRLEQANGLHATWAEFYATERLLPQLRLAVDGKLASPLLKRGVEGMCTRLGELFPVEPPALLHGDLWSGNSLTDAEGRPVLVDPSVHHGHREMDLGMMRLFGGFPAETFSAYQAERPLEAGWEKRIPYAQLYPLMVHLNLFGEGYLPDVQEIVRQFVQ